MSRQNGIQLRERFYAIYVCNENTQFLAAASFLPVQYECRGVGIGVGLWPPHILTDQLYLHLNQGGQIMPTTFLLAPPPGFSNLPTTLICISI